MPTVRRGSGSTSSGYCPRPRSSWHTTLPTRTTHRQTASLSSAVLMNESLHHTAPPEPPTTPTFGGTTTNIVAVRVFTETDYERELEPGCTRTGWHRWPGWPPGPVLRPGVDRRVREAVGTAAGRGRRLP
jgi:hypothetical protein